jgi:hypothetical protein
MGTENGDQRRHEEPGLCFESLRDLPETSRSLRLKLWLFRCRTMRGVTVTEGACAAPSRVLQLQSWTRNAHHGRLGRQW